MTATRRQQMAQLLTEVLAPAVLVVVLLIVVALYSSSSLLSGLGWGALAALFVGVIPYLFLLSGVRRGRWTDKHVRLREQRTVPLLFALACSVVGLFLLGLLGAPDDLIALVIAGLAGLLVTIAITLAWKISVHAAVAGGTAMILTLLFGLVVVPAWSLVASVAWARVEIQGHTRAQVLAGSLVGATVAAAAFLASRNVLASGA